MGLTQTFVSHNLIVKLAAALTWTEMMEDPGDLVAIALRQAAEGFTTNAQS